MRSEQFVKKGEGYTRTVLFIQKRSPNKIVYTDIAQERSLLPLDFVLRKKGSKEEEENERGTDREGDYRPPTRKIFEIVAFKPNSPCYLADESQVRYS